MKKILGFILILAGITLLAAQFIDFSLFPASIFLEKTTIIASPNESINLRYTLLNTYNHTEYYSIFIMDGNVILASKLIILPSKTIFNGILSFSAPTAKGTYTYKIIVFPTKEQETITVVVN